MKRFIMYGAGNIGRGFIGQIMSENGYEVGFIDLNTEVIDRLNRDHRYPVNIITRHENREIIVENVYGIDGRDIERVVEEIDSCDLMATAVGANALKYIARPIAKGIERRLKRDASPLNIIICENLIGADEYLKGLIKAELGSFGKKFEECVGLVEASIGRMVPILNGENKKDNPLQIYVEPYNILPVDKDAFRGGIPDIKNLYPFSPFSMFIQRKLYMHNMSHALCAYLGYLKGYTYIYEAIGDYDIRYMVFKALAEMALTISIENKINIKDLLAHAENLLYRFQNSALCDTVERVGKDTKRKLAMGDRLTGALRLTIEHDIQCNYLCVGIAAAMFFDPAGDENSIEVAEYARSQGIVQALNKYCGFDCEKDKKIVELITKLYGMFSSGKQLFALIRYCDELNSGEIII